ncbi:GNAT family N-acetyltransferase [Mesorhizobium sp. M0244]|uniref:GNAT family N-acetyltransferase n=1 Tax=Mesorhizobium sp. M0244 TaxID=2956926 RepID=UPI003338E7FA
MWRLFPASDIGYCGLVNVPYHAHFTPAVEIAWRLHPDCWGRGYATEAAVTALTFGFRAALGHTGIGEQWRHRGNGRARDA